MEVPCYVFIDETGFAVLEHDGPYPGDFCASATHPGHEDYDDSQWKQWRQVTDFYKGLRARGLYMNLPDIYHLSGSNKIGIGYREVKQNIQSFIFGVNTPTRSTRCARPVDMMRIRLP